MEIRKAVLYIALGLACLSLWTAWEKDYGKPSKEVASVNPTEPEVATAVSGVVRPNEVVDTKIAALPASQLIQVHTDVFDLAIDQESGNIVRAFLPKYPIDLQHKSTPIQILSDDPEQFYIAENGLSGEKIQYKASKSEFTLDANSNQLLVSLVGVSKNHLQVVKTYEFTRGNYAVKLNYKLINLNKQHDWTGALYAQIRQHKPEEHRAMFGFSTYTGPTFSSSDKPYEKISYDKLKQQNVDRDTVGGWLATQQRYFLSVWIPDQTKTNHYYSKVMDSIYLIGVSTPVAVAAGKEATHVLQFYVGPEIQENLAALAKNLNLTIDYGWLWMISQVIFWTMRFIHRFVGNWGWSIIMVTILIKLVFFKLSESSFRSMAKMRALSPKIKALQERCGGDRQKLNVETMKLYRAEKVNPLGGCLPNLVQIPVFIGLYYVLIEAVELRQAPFMLWIQDLSIRDPFFVLPILMGVSMLIQQKLNPASPDPTQAKVMMFMPVIFTVLFASFPAGLVLYWLTNNILSVLQQWYIIRSYDHKRH